MTFVDRMDRVEGTPTVRPPGCICPPVVGGWDENCPLHPMDDANEPFDLAVQQIIAEHDPGCVENAVSFAVGSGVDDPYQFEQVAAQHLADGDVACICGAAG